MEISAEVLIPASLSTVWGALVDFPHYRSWHPLVEIDGEAEEGANIDYFYRNNVEAPRSMSMKATITTLIPARELRIEMGVKGIVMIEERYLLQRQGTQVRVLHSADLRGLVPLLAGRLFRKRLTEKFQLSIDWLARHLAAKQLLKSQR
ncbi:MAG: hypothetical protein EBR34_08635 [Sphingomonadaceae bacterium]|nr:hypothetical protein [Sphingomonadaceae bacterium]